MERRYGLVIALLACAGAAIAALLTYSQYFPAVTEGLAICSGKYAGNCNALHQWKFAVVFGIPLAGYGLFAYTVILASALFASFASARNCEAGFALVAALTVLSLAADVVLGGVMVWLKAICLLCVTTYVINGLMLLVAIFWYLYLRKHRGFTWRGAANRLLAQSTATPRNRAAAVLCGVSALVLFYAIFSASQFFQTQAIVAKQARDKEYVEAFFRKPASLPTLPDSSLLVGSREAKVKFVVFTDFLCSACYEFYLFEKELPARYGDRVSVAYYNYARGDSSKMAAKAVLAAARLNILPQYLDKHFGRYQEVRAKYSQAKAMEVATGLAEPDRFRQEMGAAGLDGILQRDFELAQGINIIGTPTLFINGRRIDGVPSREVMEALVDRELRSIAAR